MTKFEMRDVVPVKPAAPWVGGKKQLSRRLAFMIDGKPHNAYVEVFAGMGGVFLKRRRAPRTEVINDLNRDVATFFRVLQNHYQALMDMFKWQLTSRDEFERLNGMDPERLTDLQRAARFLYLQRTAFGGKVAGRSFGTSSTGGGRFDVTKLGEILAAVHERLAGVIIECQPWQKLIDRWDRPGTLFYMDPPYYGTEHYYGRGMF
jgi:DNA adenine methylase